MYTKDHKEEVNWTSGHHATFIYSVGFWHFLSVFYFCKRYFLNNLLKTNIFRAFCFKIRKSTCNIALRVRVGESQQPTCFSCALWCEGSCVPRSWWAAKDGSLSTWWKHVLRSRSFRVVKELSLGWRTKETNFQLIFRPVSSSSNKIITFQKATCLFHNKCKIWHLGLKRI